tara:strand:- start:22 stop:156 length:135 start_codon:yes stop_codon:yes gene_type:complete
MEKEDEFYKFEEKNVNETSYQSEDFMMSELDYSDKKAIENGEKL